MHSSWRVSEYIQQPYPCRYWCFYAPKPSSGLSFCFKSHWEMSLISFQSRARPFYTHINLVRTMALFLMNWWLSCQINWFENFNRLTTTSSHGQANTTKCHIQLKWLRDHGKTAKNNFANTRQSERPRDMFIWDSGPLPSVWVVYDRESFIAVIYEFESPVGNSRRGHCPLIVSILGKMTSRTNTQGSHKKLVPYCSCYNCDRLMNSKVSCWTNIRTSNTLKETCLV